VPVSVIAIQSQNIQLFDLESISKVPNGIISKKDYFEENEIFFHPG
jgi:hypothetical protein